jgi:hypothetical protein
LDKVFSLQYAKIYFKRVESESVSPRGPSQSVSVGAENSEDRWTSQVAS